MSEQEVIDYIQKKMTVGRKKESHSRLCKNFIELVENWNAKIDQKKFKSLV